MTRAPQHNDKSIISFKEIDLLLVESGLKFGKLALTRNIEQSKLLGKESQYPTTFIAKNKSSIVDNI